MLEYISDLLKGLAEEFLYWFAGALGIVFGVLMAVGLMALLIMAFQQ